VHGEPDLASVPVEHRDLVGRALSTDPADRPTVTALLQALRGDPQATVAEAIAATWTGDDATKISTTQILAPAPPESGPAHRHSRVLVGAIAAVLIVAAAAIAAVLVTSNDQDQGAVARTTTTQPASAATAATATSLATKKSEPEATTTTAPKPPDVKSLQLQDVPLRQLCLGDTVAIKGNGERVPVDDGEYSAEVVGTTYTDMTGDGREDAIVATSCGYVGGNHPSASVVLVSSELDGPRQLGDPIEGAAPTVHGNGVVVERPIYTESDAMCCPSGTEYAPIVGDDDGWHESTAKQLSADDRATTGRLGALKVGDAYADLAAAVGGSVEIHDDAETDGSCVWVTIPTLDADISGLGGDGRLHSLEIDDPAIMTKSGLGIGSTEAEIQGAFPGKITSDDHPYQPGGHYLTFEAEDGSGSAVFETNGSTVSRYRIGEPGWTSAIEGCL
jgi:hypothetical protein